MKKLFTLFVGLTLALICLQAQNNALSFDGVDDYIKTPLVTTAIDNISMEAWVKWNGDNGKNQYILLNGHAAFNGYGMFINKSNSNQISIICCGVGYVNSSATLTPNTWQHVVASRKNGIWELHIDGLQKPVSPNTTTPITPAGDTYIGSHNGGADNFNGIIDDVKFKNSTGIVADYQFNQGIANGTNTGITTLTEASASTKNGTLNNFALTGATSNWVAGMILTVAANTATLNTANSNTTTVAVTSNLTWTAISSDTWLTVTPNIATSGNAVLTISASAMTPGLDRTATITLMAPGVTSQVITVTQTNLQTNALSFDGSNDYVQAPLATTAINNVTMEAWVNWNGANSANQFILLNGDAGLSGYGIYINKTNSNYITIVCGGVAFLNSSVSLTPNIWQHIAAVRESGTWKLYINGVVAALTSNTAIPNAPAGNTYIGSNNVGTETFKGAIDEVRIWNIARSATDITNSMNAELTNPSATNGLVAYYPFNQGIANGTNTGITTLTDASTSAKTGTLKNFALTGATSNWVAFLKLNVSANTATLNTANSNTTTVTVTSNLTWTAASSDTWLTVTPNIATSGNDVLNISASAMTPGLDRTATITLSAPGVSNQVITVTQTNPAILTLAANTATLNTANSNATTIAVTSNLTWTAVSSASWLMVTPTAAITGNATLNISATAIPIGTADRTATITLSATGVSNQVITVTQTNPAILTLAANTATLNTANSNATTIAVTSNLTWTLLSSAAWLTITPPATGVNNAVLNISATAIAIGTADRTATITLSATGVSNQVITVTQTNPVILTVSKTEIGLSAFKSNSATLDVASNVPWTAVSSQSWLSVSPAVATPAMTTLTVSASSITNDDRTATVTITAGATSKVITVKQKVVSLPYVEDFETISFFKNIFETNPVHYDMGGIPQFSIVSIGSYPTALPYSGSRMIKFNSFDIFSPKSARLSLPAIHTLGYNSVTLSFYMYHSNNYSTLNDKVQIETSIDGINWVSAGTTISRYSASNGWVQHTISLSTIDNLSNVLVGILGISDYGRNIYLDNVEINGTPIATVIDNTATSSVSIYPNPTSEVINLSSTQGIQNITITNLAGNTIWSGLAAEFPINISTFAKGIYLVNMVSATGVKTEKVIIK